MLVAAGSVGPMKTRRPGLSQKVGARNSVVVLPAKIEGGLPVGLQFAVKLWQDEAQLFCCERVESATNAFTPPPNIGQLRC